MINFQSWKTFVYFAKAYPTRGAFVVLSLVVAGLLEGIGVMALLPLVALLTEQTTDQSGIIFEFIQTVFSTFSITPTVASLLLFIVALIVLKAFITMLAMIQVAYTSAHVCTDLRLAYLNSALKSSWAYFVGLQSGASANALGTEAQRSTLAFTQGCYVLSWSIQVIVYTALAFMISYPLTLYAVLAGIIMVSILSFLVRMGRRAGNEQTRILNSVLARITDTLYGAKPLKAMGKTDNLLSMMKSDVLILQSAQRRVNVASHAVRVLSEPIMVIFVAIGIYAILTFGQLPVAELLFLSLLFLRMVMKISAVQDAYLSMAANESAMWSLKSKIDKARALTPHENGRLPPTLQKGIALENVSFAYDQNVIIRDVSLSLPTTGFFVIFGPSGEGKTTLLDLVIGLHQPLAGEIRIDGVPLPSIDIEQWRHKIGYVPQDVLLFHDTVKNNVTLNDPRITDEEVVEALKTADALGFVEKMENGLETVVGERGAKISGGQRQRIAISRALIGNPPLLILDEATSALDKNTEQDILETVKRLSKNTLVLCISHNPQSIRMADKVFKMKSGALTEMDIEGLERT